MLLLPLLGHRSFEGTTFDCCVVYVDGTENQVGAGAITEWFGENSTTFMHSFLSRRPACHVPSDGECGWRYVGSDDCLSASSQMWRRFDLSLADGQRNTLESGA